MLMAEIFKIWCYRYPENICFWLYNSDENSDIMKNKKTVKKKQYEKKIQGVVLDKFGTLNRLNFLRGDSGLNT